MNCLARIGCLTLLVIFGIVAWLTRDRWLPLVGGHARPTAVTVEWEPITHEHAHEAQIALEKLSGTSGPVFANLTGAQAASYIFEALSDQLPRSADSVEAAVIGERLYLRASVELRELGGQAVLGPVADLFSGREQVQFGGTFHVLRQGLAEFQVLELRIRDFNVPASVIPRMVTEMDRSPRPEGLSPSGLPLVIPKWVGDVRIANHKVTVYKNVE